MSDIKQFLKYLIPAIMFVYLTYLTWLDLKGWAIIVLIVSSLLISFSFYKYMKGRNFSAKIEQYRILLEYLSSRLASGHTLETTLLEAFNRLKDELGRKSILAKCLKQLEQGMNAHLDLDRCLQTLKSNFNCQTCDAFFDVLPYLNHYGGRLDVFVKQTYRTLNAEIQMQKDIAAEQNAQNSEAIVLIFLPFLFSLVLIRNDTSYSHALAEVAWARPLLAIIFIMAHLAICWTLLIMAKNPVQFKNRDIFINFSTKKSQNKFILFLSQFLLTYLPARFGYNLAEGIRILSQNQPNAWQVYTKKKLKLSIIFSFFGLLLCFLKIISWSLFLVFPIFIWLIQDIDILQRVNRLKQQIQIEYPNFLNSMVILLKSGLSLERSLSLMIDSYHNNLHSQLKSDLAKIKHSLSVGESASFSLIQIAENLPQEEIASLLQLMARYDRDGGQEILDILDLQANSSWQLYRNAMRRRLQNKNMGLMFPMTIDLFIVIVMAMLPAVANLGNIQI